MILCIKSIHSIPADVKYMWDSMCRIVNIVDQTYIGKVTCAAGSILIGAPSEENNKYMYQVQPGKCESIQVHKDGITEICSSPPYQLYFQAADYKVNGCYQRGTPNKDYYQCCQFRHNTWTYVPPNGMVAVQQVWGGYFCSGPKQNDKSYKSVSQHGLSWNLKENKDPNKTDVLIYYNTKLAKDICEKDWKSSGCNDAEDNLSRIYRLNPKWHTVKTV